MQGAPAISAADGAYVAGNATRGIDGLDGGDKSVAPTSVAGDTPATTPVKPVELLTRLESSATVDTVNDSPSPETPLIESQWRVDPTMGPSQSRQLEDVSPTPAAKETHAGCEASGTPPPPPPGDTEASEKPGSSPAPSMAPSALAYDKYYYQCPS